jgi:hypothetical protein
MIDIFQDPSPVVIMALMMLLALFIRMRAAEKSRAHVLQLTEAADLLETHARSLEAFLDDPASPVILKRLLLTFSDAMADRAIVEKLGEWAASRPFDQPIESEEATEVQASLEALRGLRPALVENFTTTVLTAATGASLRWPESAALFSRAFPRMIGTPKRDIAIAVTATRLGFGTPFSVRSPAAAMA